MEARSQKLQVLIALCEHLRGIRPENGYDIDISQAVFRGRATFGDDDPIPMISILENPRQDGTKTAATNGVVRSQQWSLLMQGWSADDDENPTDPAYEFLYDVERRLSEITQTEPISGRPVDKDIYLLGGLISNLTVGDAVVRPPEPQVSSKAFFFLPISILLVSTLGDS